MAEASQIIARHRVANNPTPERKKHLQRAGVDAHSDNYSLHDVRTFRAYPVASHAYLPLYLMVQPS